MNVHPYMEELRSLLGSYGIDFEADDSEEETDEYSGAILHVERTLFRAPDGRNFTVSYAWIRDENEQKHFLPQYCKYNYLDVTVGDSESYAADPDDVLEDAIGHVM